MTRPAERLSVTARCARFALPGGVEGWSFGDPNAPLVVLQHGLGSRKERMLELALRCADAGFHGVALDAPAHGDRRDDPRAAPLGDREHPEFVPALVSVLEQGVAEMARVVDAFGAAHWMVAGHSLGGRMALEALRVHPGVRAAAAVGAPLGDLLIPPGLPEPLRKALVATAPERQGDAYARRPLLLCHGIDDPVTPVEGSRGLHEALGDAYAGAPERLRLHCVDGVGHDLAPVFQESVVDFLREHAA
jgi:pimeloyl-ACP methyl ester carboxylesterase